MKNNYFIILDCLKERENNFIFVRKTQNIVMKQKKNAETKQKN